MLVPSRREEFSIPFKRARSHTSRSLSYLARYQHHAPQLAAAGNQHAGGTGVAASHHACLESLARSLSSVSPCLTSRVLRERPSENSELPRRPPSRTPSTIDHHHPSLAKPHYASIYKPTTRHLSIHSSIYLSLSR